MDNEEFERQLLLESKEKAFKEKEEKDNPYLTRDKDGVLYEWDPERKAWFPKIDDTFLAYYQQYNYHYVEPETSEENKKVIKSTDDNFKVPLNPKSSKELKLKSDSKKLESEMESDLKKEDPTNQPTFSKHPNKDKNKQEVKKQPEWFEIDEDHNTNVYVSNLPEDITNEEFVELMQKCGLILKDSETNQLKIKLYKDKSTGKLKGDALCTYIKPESVILALQILDGYLFKGKEISVERAKFELKGEYDPTKKPRKRKQEDKAKLKKKISRLFSWQPDKLPDERSKREKVVIIKNFFDPEEFDKDPTLISEYKRDIEEECKEKCGPIKKVTIYDRNKEGVVAVFYKEFEHADKCVNLMNGRFFAGRQLTAQNWDGRTKYKVKETKEEEERRIAEWNKYLEDS